MSLGNTSLSSAAMMSFTERVRGFQLTADLSGRPIKAEAVRGITFSPLDVIEKPFCREEIVCT